MLNVSSEVMSRYDPKTPSLDNALASGFANLKVGEGNLEPIVSPTEQKQESIDDSHHKPAYGQRIRHVEDRSSFTVKPSAATQTTVESPLEIIPSLKGVEEIVAKQVPEKPILLNAPSSEVGQDFDVEW